MSEKEKNRQAAEAEYGIGYLMSPDSGEREPQPYEGEGVGRQDQVYTDSKKSSQDRPETKTEGEQEFQQKLDHTPKE